MAVTCCLSLVVSRCTIIINQFMNLPQICSSKTMDSQVDGTYNSVSSAICSEKRLSIFFPESLLFFHLLPNYNYMMLVVELLLSEIGEFSL